MRNLFFSRLFFRLPAKVKLNITTPGARVAVGPFFDGYSFSGLGHLVDGIEALRPPEVIPSKSILEGTKDSGIGNANTSLKCSQGPGRCPERLQATTYCDSA